MYEYLQRSESKQLSNLSLSHQHLNVVILHEAIWDMIRTLFQRKSWMNPSNSDTMWVYWVCTGLTV